MFIEASKESVAVLNYIAKKKNRNCARRFFSVEVSLVTKKLIKMMNDAAALAGMLPYDTIGLYEQPKPRFIFKMPRVVPDQKSKFDSDELFRRLSRESEVSFKFCFCYFLFINLSVFNKTKNVSVKQMYQIYSFI